MSHLISTWLYNFFSNIRKFVIDCNNRKTQKIVRRVHKKSISNQKNRIEIMLEIFCEKNQKISLIEYKQKSNINRSRYSRFVIYWFQLLLIYIDREYRSKRERDLLLTLMRFIYNIFIAILKNYTFYCFIKYFVYIFSRSLRFWVQYFFYLRFIDKIT